MCGTQFSDDDLGQDDLDQDDLSMLVGEANHRIHDLLAMIEAAISQTQSAGVEHYRSQLMAQISALRSLHVISARSHRHSLNMTELIEQTLRPYCAGVARVLAGGPDFLLRRKLALALSLIFNELAMNAKKYGALSCARGHVEVQWKIRHVPGASRRLAVVWSEHGGPEVKQPRRRGFGSRLLKKALEGFGGLRLDFNKAGLACLMVIYLDDVETTMPENRSPQIVPEFDLMPDVMTC